MGKIKTFFSYYHKENDNQRIALQKLINGWTDIDDVSVDSGDIIDENKTDENIRKIIRDEYLRDSTVTIVICGTMTKHRKHVDWEIMSSMYDGPVNKKSGIIVVTCGPWNSSTIPYKAIRDSEYSDRNFYSMNASDKLKRYSYLPDRLKDNIAKEGVDIIIMNYSDVISKPTRLLTAINYSHENRKLQNYDTSRPRRMKNNDSQSDRKL